MKISALRILELNEKYNLIENLAERELKNPEGVDIDIRVGRVEKIVGDTFLGVNERASAKTELVADIERDGEKSVTIRPGEYYLVKTMETINCPSEPIKYDENFPKGYIVPDIRPRVSLQKGGVSLDSSTTNPGYSGPLWFGVSNNSQHDFTFELGARMFKIYWGPVVGDIKRTYEGQHQGGRVTSQGKKETQV